MATAEPLQFKNPYASLVLSMSSPGIYRLRNLETSRPRQGYGTDVMRKACSWADANQCRLVLRVEAYGDSRETMDNEQLVAFYESFGFERMKTETPIRMVHMIRRPNSQK